MKVELWQIDKVIPYENNVKKHDSDQVNGIAESIKKFGFDQPIVVDKDGVIIKGHGRRLACLKLGLETVPVLVRDDLSEDQVKAARLADNRVAVGDIDTIMLRLEMESINDDLLKGIFSDKEREFMVADLGNINVDAFVTDLNAQVEKQKEQTDSRIEAASLKPISLFRAFGFKHIRGEDQLYITKFMAKAEFETGLKEDAALVEYLKRVLQES
jgi:hypothetical protein